LRAGADVDDVNGSAIGSEPRNGVRRSVTGMRTVRDVVVLHYRTVLVFDVDL
jgi:hypothetical protein